MSCGPSPCRESMSSATVAAVLIKSVSIHIAVYDWFSAGNVSGGVSCHFTKV